MYISLWWISVVWAISTATVKPIEKIISPVGQRNLLFVAVCIFGIGAVGSSFLQSDKIVPPKEYSAEQYQNPEFVDIVEDIDAEFAAYWEKEGLIPAPPADYLTRIRRLSLGLTGTIPSLQQIRVFEEVSPSNNPIQWWLSHLFEDRRTSDYLAERFARSYVGVENGPFITYRRRRFVGWLSDQFHENRRYDEVVRSLITAEGIWTGNPEVNFITVTIDQNDGESNPDEVKLAARVTRAFLGVRIDCVQCHDDYLDERWEQKDFHQLASFFSGTDMKISGIRETGKSYKYKYRRKPLKEVPKRVPFLSELLPDSGAPRERLAGWVTHQENRSFARTTVNRIWALMFGRPLVEPVDEIPLEGPYPPGLEILVDDLIKNNFDLQRLIRVIASTRVFGLDSKVSEGYLPLTANHDRHWAAFPVSRLRPEQVAGSIVQAASLTTIDADSHILFRMARAIQQGEFVKHYGDIGEDEFHAQVGTISQRLLLMNGKLVYERTKEDLVANAATRILATAQDDSMVVEASYLSVLTRRPSQAEQNYFIEVFDQNESRSRQEKQEDLYWALINSTEFSWNN